MATLQISDIQLFNALKSKLGDNEAEQLVTFVKSYVKDEINEQVPNLATKEDLIKETSALRLEMREMEVRITRNIFIAGVVQFLAIVGSVLMLLKFHIS